MERSSTGIKLTFLPSGSSICVGIRQALLILALLLPGYATLGNYEISPDPVSSTVR